MVFYFGGQYALSIKTPFLKMRGGVFLYTITYQYFEIL